MAQISVAPRQAWAWTRTLEDSSRFGRRLAALRIRRGLHASNLAAMVGVHENTVVNWECDRTDPPMRSLIALARALDVSLDELVLGGAP